MKKEDKLEIIKNLIAQVQSKMEATYANFEKDLKSVNTGVANPSLLEGILATLPGGSNAKLERIATISAPNYQMLLVNVWDKLNVGAVNKAILSSGLGLTPIVEGTVLRVRLPILTTDRRQELVKVVKKYSEKCKVDLRNIKKHIHLNKTTKGKDKDVEAINFSEDEKRDIENKLNKLLATMENNVEVIVSAKIKQIDKYK